jgi:hypothetical protein
MRRFAAITSTSSTRANCVRQSGWPGDGGGIAKLLDTVQKGVNVATRQALYQVVLSGSASKPQARAVPSPFLSEQVTRLLGATMDRSRKSGLLDTLHNDPALTTAPAGASAADGFKPSPRAQRRVSPCRT